MNLMDTLDTFTIDYSIEVSQYIHQLANKMIFNEVIKNIKTMGFVCNARSKFYN